MAEPLSFAASIVGIVVPALHGTRLLLEDVRKISEAHDTLKQLAGELAAIEAALKSLRAVTDPQWEALGPSVVEQSEIAVSFCQTSCKTFHQDFKKWTRHSIDGQLSFRDRTGIGFFRQKRVVDMSERLRACKDTLVMTATTAALHSSLRLSGRTDEVLSMMNSQVNRIDNIAAAASNQTVAVQAEMEAPPATENNHQESEHLESDEQWLDVLTKLLAELKSQLLEEQRKRPAPSGPQQTVTFGGHNRGFQIGSNSGSISEISFR